MTTRKLTAAARLTPSQVDDAARDYLSGWDSPDPVEATAERGLSPVDAERLAETYGPRYGRRIGRALVALCRQRSASSAAARALGSISTPRKAKSSAANGRAGGRIPTTVHVTRIGPAGEVFGHAARHCNESGCSGTERYLGAIEGAERGHVYELDGRRIVAEIV